MNRDLLVLLPYLNCGGIERVGINIFNNLPTTIRKELVLLYKLDEVYYNIEVVSICKYNKSVWYRLLQLPIIIYKYYFILKKYNPKVCLSFDGTTNLVNVISSILFKVKPIISYHTMPSTAYKFQSKVTEIIITLIARHTKTKVIAVSNGVKNELISSYNLPSEKIDVIYNPCDILEIERASHMTVDIISCNKPIIITVGRLAEIKAQQHIIRTFSHMIRMTPATLLICGEGPQYDYLKNMVNKLNISDSVIFLGWQDNPHKYMSNAIFFVQSSLSEALPNVLVEALACGCPVVAANCSLGIEEILGLDSSCGFITEKMTGICYTADEPLDSGEQNLLYYMKKLVDNPELRKAMSQAGKERANFFSMDVGIKKYSELIEGMIKDS